MIIVNITIETVSKSRRERNLNVQPQDHGSLTVCMLPASILNNRARGIC